MIRFFKRKRRVEGIIGMFGLQDWWFSTFSEADREWMADTYAPMGTSVRTLIEGGFATSRPPSFEHLLGIAPWFSKEGYQHCAIAFLDKAMEFYSEDIPVLGRHFGLYNQSLVLYRWRDVEPQALEKCLAICEKCIEFHEEAARAYREAHGIMPHHGCFDRLRIVEERRGNYERALELCRTAQAAGWVDDWPKHISRIERKIAKGR